MTGTPTVAAVLAAVLPLKVEGIDWSPPDLKVWGSGWSLSGTFMWRLADDIHVRACPGEGDNAKVTHLVGLNVDRISFHGNGMFDPYLHFSNGENLELFSELTDRTWTLTLSGRFIEGALTPAELGDTREVDRRSSKVKRALRKNSNRVFLNDDREGVPTVEEALERALPLRIREVDWTWPCLTVWGDGWSLSGIFLWRVTRDGQVLTSSGADDAADRVWDLIGATIVKVTFCGDNILDAYLHLSSGEVLELFSEFDYDTWILNVPSLSIDGPLHRGDIDPSLQITTKDASALDRE